MVKIVGNDGCSRCEIVKGILKQKNIDFEYALFSEIKEVDELQKKAVEKGVMSFPIILKDGEIVDFQEVIN